MRPKPLQKPISASNVFHNNALGYDAIILSGTVNRSRRRDGGVEQAQKGTAPKYQIALFIENDPINRQPEAPGSRTLRSIGWGAVAELVQRSQRISVTPDFIALWILDEMRGAPHFVQLLLRPLDCDSQPPQSHQ